jgi:apolipoprotein N-acyltransferase
VSAVFDPAGRRVAHKPLEEPGVIVAAMPRNPGTGSFYSRFGNIFVALCAAGTVLLMASAMYSGRAFPRHAAGPRKPL